MTLYPVKSMGIEAYCSDVITDPHQLDTVYFLSVCGYQATVKGIVANLIENNGISIKIEGIEYYLVRSEFGYKTLVKKLPSGLVHAVLFPKPALAENDENNKNSFFIFKDRHKGEELLSLFFRHLDEKTNIPLHPSWRRWLWRVFEAQQEWFVKLRTLAGTYSGYFFDFNPHQLQNMVSDAIRNKVPEMIECIKRKGGD